MSNSLELKLRKIGRSLADKQICRFWKVPEEMRETPCDFFGYTRTGRAILIEAKMVNRPRLPIGCSPGLSKNQWNELCDAERAGAIVIVVWERYGCINCMEPKTIRSLANGKKSVPWNKFRFMPATTENLESFIDGIIYFKQKRADQRLSEQLATQRRRPSLDLEQLQPAQQSSPKGPRRG